MNIYEITPDKGKQYLIENGIELKQAGQEFGAQYDDLARLYYLIRERRPKQVLEFGSGHSTVVMGKALKDNGEGKLIALETSDKWAEVTREKSKGLPVDIVLSEVIACSYEGQVCHFYTDLPDVTPDFIYLDGPDPADVQGEVHGLTFKHDRTVMAADPLVYESTLLPGFFMIADGRTNNARFLARNLKRDYEIKYHPVADVTTFEMTELRLRGGNPLNAGN